MRKKLILNSTAIIALTAISLTGCTSSSAPKVALGYYSSHILKVFAFITSCCGWSVDDFTSESKSKTALYEGYVSVPQKGDCFVDVNSNLNYIRSEFANFASISQNDFRYGKDANGYYVGIACDRAMFPNQTWQQLDYLTNSVWFSVKDTLKVTDMQVS